MAKILKYYFLFLMLIALHSTYGQTIVNDTSRKTLDSLFTVLKSTTTNTSKTIQIQNTARTLAEIGWEYRKLGEYTSAITYLKKAEKLLKGKDSETLKILRQVYIYWAEVYEKKNDYKTALEQYKKALNINQHLQDPKELEKLYSLIGSNYYYLDQYENALDYMEKSLHLCQQIGNKNAEGERYNEIGNVYWFQGDYENALKNFLKALTICEALNNFEGVSNSYFNIGYIYLYQENTKKAFEVFNKGLEISQKHQIKNEIANAYNGLGDAYDKIGDYENAIKSHIKFREVSEEIKDSFGISRAYGNIGIAYAHKKDYKNALENYFSLLKISSQIEDNLGVADANHYIGDAYLNQMNYSKAFPYLEQALKKYKEMGYKEGIKDSYNSLSQLYEKTGNYKQAYESYTQFSEIKDSMFNEQSSKQIMEMSTKYESEKKGKDIESLTKDKALQESQLNQQKFVRNSFIIGLLIAIVIALVTYSRYLVKQKLNETLSYKNTELVEKNSLIEKQKERILDSINYAQRIQQSILVDENEIKKLLPDSFVLFLPKDIVSGDFYWFTQTANKIIIAAIDCTGHGVPGAFMSMIGNALLNQIINEKHITKPSEILYHLNRGVFESLHQEKESPLARDGMDIALCTIDTDQKTIEYAGARNPLYFITSNTLQEIKANKQTIGSAGHISTQSEIYKTEFTNHTLSITDDLCIYIFSDGYKDQFNTTEKKKFGAQRFKELLLQIHSQPMVEQKQLLDKTMQDWQGDMAQIDDMLVIGIKFKC